MTCLCQVKARFRFVPDDYCTSGFTSHYCCNLKSKATGYVRQEASHPSRHVSLCCRDDKKTLGLYGDYLVFAELHRVHDGFGPARVLIALLLLAVVRMWVTGTILLSVYMWLMCEMRH